MQTNVGSSDRVVRIVLGAILLVLPFLPGLGIFASPVAFWAALVVGAVLLLTALVGFCPLYTLLGISTCKVSSR